MPHSTFFFLFYVNSKFAHHFLRISTIFKAIFDISIWIFISKIVRLHSMKKKISYKTDSKTLTLKRENKIAFSLNEKEYNMMRQYLDKHKIENQSRWVREVIMGYLWKKAEESYPTLFDESEIRK